jgi:hypothetical protein
MDKKLASWKHNSMRQEKSILGSGISGTNCSQVPRTQDAVR